MGKNSAGPKFISAGNRLAAEEVLSCDTMGVALASQIRYVGMPSKKLILVKIYIKCVVPVKRRGIFFFIEKMYTNGSESNKCEQRALNMRTLWFGFTR